MSTIKIEIPFTEKNVELTKGLLSKADLVENVNGIAVTDAEEVKAPAKKAPAQRASRAKAKPEPEPEEDEDADDDFADEEDSDFEEEADEEEITEDTLRELSAKKITKHKDAIVAQLAKFKDKAGKPVKGWGVLPEKHYQAMFDFLTKLK